MEDRLITSETAELAKKKNFDIIQKKRYCKILKKRFPFTTKKWGKKIGDIILTATHPKNETIKNNNGTLISLGEAPTQSLLQKWLREKHGIILQICFSRTFGYYYRIDRHGVIEKKYFNTYEKALEKGLQEALKLLQIKDKIK